MGKLYLIALAGILAATSAQAATQCYTPAEMKAEQLLRLHSELMVITVTCHQSSIGENLVPFYTGFTKINIHPLHEAEQTLMRHYKATYGGTGVDWLDKLRTRLGNEFGQVIADASAPQFCAERRDKVREMYNASPEDIDNEVARLTETATPYECLCGQPPARIARKGK